MLDNTAQVQDQREVIAEVQPLNNNTAIVQDQREVIAQVQPLNQQEAHAHEDERDRDEDEEAQVQREVPGNKLDNTAQVQALHLQVQDQVEDEVGGPLAQDRVQQYDQSAVNGLIQQEDGDQEEGEDDDPLVRDQIQQGAPVEVLVEQEDRPELIARSKSDEKSDGNISSAEGRPNSECDVKRQIRTMPNSSSMKILRLKPPPPMCITKKMGTSRKKKKKLNNTHTSQSEDILKYFTRTERGVLVKDEDGSGQSNLSISRDLSDSLIHHPSPPQVRDKMMQQGRPDGIFS